MNSVLKQLLIQSLLLMFFHIFSHCAIMHKNNRRITNVLDNHFTPETTTGKVLMSPVAIPVGTISLLTDTFLLQPVIAIPMALGDTITYIWQNPSGGILTQSFLFVPKLVMTPIAFSFLWIKHAFFY
ncbi:hypothetical protein [Leptospira yanagawae]|uniref:hypothetical protein n=1 Tax=Leptospira yanagawae TaxID=293069 RepID=UPI0012EC6C6D|nr:hypothetical protein [Leptospira yanagawae]